MTVGCRVRGHLSIKQLIPTPPRTTFGGVASPQQVCICKIPTLTLYTLFVYFFSDLRAYLSFYFAFVKIFFIFEYIA